MPIQLNTQFAGFKKSYSSEKVALNSEDIQPSKGETNVAFIAQIYCSSTSKCLYANWCRGNGTGSRLSSCFPCRY